MHDLTSTVITTAGLEEAKFRAIHTTEGPVLIISDPGSDTTKTPFERIVHLVNKSVAAEKVGALHSISLRYLEEYRDHTRLKRSYRLLDDIDQKLLLFRNFSEYLEVKDAEILLGRPLISRKDKAQNHIPWLSKVSEDCLDPDMLCESESREISKNPSGYSIPFFSLCQTGAAIISTPLYLKQCGQWDMRFHCDTRHYSNK